MKDLSATRFAARALAALPLLCAPLAAPAETVTAEPDAFLEYVEATGTQYVDTGVNAETGLKARVDFAWASGTISGNDWSLLDAIERFRSPWLGICWDSGHAQLSRSDTPDIPEQGCRASWKKSGWPDGPDEWSNTGKYLERLLPNIVTCHLHSNDRVVDRHWEPTDPRGRTDWAAEMPLLLSAPRMKQLQNEASIKPDLPVTVREHVESLRDLVARF